MDSSCWVFGVRFRIELMVEERLLYKFGRTVSVALGLVSVKYSVLLVHHMFRYGKDISDLDMLYNNLWSNGIE